MKTANIYPIIMSRIADYTIKVCKEWKTMKGRKCKRVLASKYGGAQGTWKNAM